MTVNCFIAEGSEIYGSVTHSIISMGCTIGENALVEDSVIMPGVVIEPGAIVRHAILGENSRVGCNAIVGGAFKPSDKKKISVPNPIKMAGTHKAEIKLYTDVNATFTVKVYN